MYIMYITTLATAPRRPRGGRVGGVRGPRGRAVRDAPRAGRPRAVTAVTEAMGAKLLEYAAEVPYGEGAASFLLKLQADLGLTEEQVPSVSTVQRWLNSQNLV